MRGNQRVGALDGLRGVAALIVVNTHVLLATSLAGIPSASGPWWVTRTPLEILFSAHEMVVVFFVLSGYVLARPAVAKGWGWLDRAYYPRRLLRLYLPVCGALIFAGVLHVLIARHVAAGTSEYLAQQAKPVSPWDGLQDATLMHMPGNALQFTGVLWSLKYEVLFSVLLPAMLVLPIITRHKPVNAILAAIACLLLIAVGSQRASGSLTSSAALLEYMPMFVLGSLLAFHADLRMRPWPVAVVAVLLLSVGNWDEYSALAETKTVVAACLVVWLALAAPSFARVLQGRVARWLGSRSYSLYLIHLPIVVTVGFVLGGRPDALILWPVAVSLSLLAAEMFWRLVERPAISVARSAGEWSLRYHAGVLSADRVPQIAERQHDPTRVVKRPA